VSFSFITGTVYAAVSLFDGGDAVTVNFGGSPWVITPTAGYGP